MLPLTTAGISSIFLCPQRALSQKRKSVNAVSEVQWGTDAVPLVLKKGGSLDSDSEHRGRWKILFSGQQESRPAWVKRRAEAATVSVSGLIPLESAEGLEKNAGEKRTGQSVLSGTHRGRCGMSAGHPQSRPQASEECIGFCREQFVRTSRNLR
jgi:hypothetical protein